MSDVSVVHLVRKQNGPEPLAQFLTAYRAHPAGVEHDLVLACKGFTSANLPDTEHRILNYPDTGYDIGTYRRAAEDVATEYIVFLNSWARPRVDGWLATLLAWTKGSGVGLIGCTDSLEGIPGSPFPNRHIRTNAFCMRRELLLELAPHDPTREQCLNFEAGPNSLTKQVEARGLRAIAQPSRAFRWGDQSNLLVADNRTDDYQHATPERRRFLQQLAWGVTE